MHSGKLTQLLRQGLICYDKCNQFNQSRLAEELHSQTNSEGQTFLFKVQLVDLSTRPLEKMAGSHSEALWHE